MSQDSHSDTERQVTTDPETIQSWAGSHTLVPVHWEKDGERHLDVVPRSKTHADHEELDWGEFERQLRDRNKIVVRSDDGVGVVDRSEVISRATVGNEAVGEALMEGETVESEVTERRVVEHVVVEAATVRSEVVDREIVRSDIVDVQLSRTDVNQCSVTRATPPDESTADLTWFRPGTQLEEAYDVVLDVEEGWELTREVVERITIESRIVDTDVEESETVETDTMRETVDIEGITETILEGELVESPGTAVQAVDHGRVHSQFREDDTIETNLLRRQTIDEELTVGKQITGDVSAAETVSSDAVAHTVVESEIVDQSEYDVDLATAVAAAETESEHERTAETDATAGEPSAGTTGTTAHDDDVPVTPSEDDEGKSVVNADGKTVGMVVDVDNGQLYVDPDPSITDRIRTVLGWSGHGDDSYMLGTDRIDRIDDDQVVLRMEHASEEHEPGR